jgi:transposase
LVFQGTPGVREKMKTLGAVTADGERFIALTPDQFNAEVAKHFLRVVQQEFEEKLAIVLDNASYFIAKTLTKQAAANGLLLEFLPPHSPETNLLEHCWCQLRETRANGCFGRLMMSRRTSRLLCRRLTLLPRFTLSGEIDRQCAPVATFDVQCGIHKRSWRRMARTFQSIICH